MRRISRKGLLWISAVMLFAAAGFYCYRYRSGLINIFPASLPEFRTSGRTMHTENRFEEKVWVHRVNSIVRARLMQQKYRGLEIDVNFDPENSCFDVYHAPAPSTGLCLEDLIASLGDPEKHYFWLDLKNLDSSNCRSVLLELNELCNRYKIKRKIILESTNISCLTPFTEEGYYTSYYIPDFNPRFMPDKEIEKIAAEISARLMEYKVCALSGTFLQLPFLEKYFPGCDLLAWHLTEDRDIFTLYTRRRLEKNERVKVLLISESSEGYL